MTIQYLSKNHTEKLLKGQSKALKQLKQHLKLTRLQKQVLVGILLGDAHLSTQDKGKTYRLHIYQSAKHENYVLHLYDIFKEWVLTKPTKKTRFYKTGLLKDKQACMISFKTLSSSAFRFYAHSFYTQKIGLAQKKVPKIIHRYLTARGLAYWFMDDGSLKSKQTKGVYLNTQGFSLIDVENLCVVLRNKFELKAKVVKKNPTSALVLNAKHSTEQNVFTAFKPEYFQIYISAESYESFKNLIKPYLISEMLYKFPSYQNGCHQR